jgi:chaperone BCS1
METIQKIFHGNNLGATALLLTAFTGIIASLIGLIKTVPTFLYAKIKRRFIFTATIYQTDVLFYNFEHWFFSHYAEKYREVEAAVNLRNGGYNHPLKESSNSNEIEKVHFKQNTGVFFIRYQGKRLVIRKGKEKIEHAKDMDSLFFNEYKISGFFAKEAISSLLNEVQVFSERDLHRQDVKIYSHTSWGDWRLSSKIRAKSVQNIVIPTKTREELIEDMDEFLTNKDWYDKTSILYKRGYFLHGIPGNGKTSLALAIAAYLNKDVYTLDLGGFSDSTGLKNAVANLGSKGVLLIEDIDGIFVQREAQGEKPKISFSVFLNCLDGTSFREGMVTIITTNHLEKMDPALLRKGRMDKIIEITTPGINEINDYLKIFFDEPVLLDHYNKQLSMCDIQDICLQYKIEPIEVAKVLQS